MRKFFVVLVWVMGLGLAALFAKDIVRGVKNVIAINHFTAQRKFLVGKF